MPEGAYSKVRAWSNGREWIEALMDAAESPAGVELRAKIRAAGGTVSLKTLRSVAEVEWAAADGNTGRGVTTSNARVGAAIRRGSKTAQRARRIIADLGFAVTVVEGRYLTKAEREEATATHGGNQTRAASVRALTMPIPSLVDKNVHLPLSRRENRFKNLLNNSTKRASARSTAASRPKQRKKSSPRPRRERAPRSIEFQRLAAMLDGESKRFTQGQHIGQLCNILEEAGIDERWTARDVLELVQPPVGVRFDNGLGWFRARLKPLREYKKIRLEDVTASRAAAEVRKLEREQQEEQEKRERFAQSEAAKAAAAEQRKKAAEKRRLDDERFEADREAREAAIAEMKRDYEEKNGVSLPKPKRWRS